MISSKTEEIASIKRKYNNDGKPEGLITLRYDYPVDRIKEFAFWTFWRYAVDRNFDGKPEKVSEIRRDKAGEFIRERHREDRDGDGEIDPE